MKQAKLVLLPGDKSIAHRALIFSALCFGRARIENFPFNEDCLATLSALKSLGVKFQKTKTSITVTGNGIFGLSKPKKPITIKESGTTYRLLLGLLAGQKFPVKLIAGKSLARRPMGRVTEPLAKMGKLGKLRGITYKMPVASAQVKSALLLAGLYAKGPTKIIEPIPTRDHTERMLKLFGADIKVEGNTVTLRPGRKLISPRKIYVPADISSAAFFMVAALIMPDMEIVIKNVSLNPTRIGVLRVLKRMGADIKVTRSQGHKVTRYEPMGNIIVKSSRLKGAVIKKEEVPSLIDELPILMVAASFAYGKSEFQGVKELRVKETDRINSMLENLRKMGADIKVTKSQGHKVTSDENIVINGKGYLRGAAVKSFGDHRTAMSMAVAGLASCGRVSIDDTGCISKSFPGFLKVLKSLK